MSARPEWEIRAFVTAATALIVRVSGAASPYYRQTIVSPDRRLQLDPNVAAAAQGALVALRPAVAADLLTSLENRIRVNVYNDLLTQAEDQIDANQTLAGMVLIGAALEQHLRNLCEARRLQWTGRGSLSAYNDVLARAPLYDQAAWRRLQVTADLRNMAAHGNTTTLDAKRLKDELDFVRTFLVNYPR